MGEEKEENEIFIETENLLIYGCDIKSLKQHLGQKSVKKYD